FDAAEDRAEICLAHQRQNIRAFRNIKGCFAAQLHRVATELLPGHEMWQQLARRLLVADEIVIDKIDRRFDAGGDQSVKLGDDLPRRFEPRLPSVQCRNITELTAVRTAARELDAADKIAPAVDQPIVRYREVGKGEAFPGQKAALRRR